MTVRELIAALQGVDPNRDIKVRDFEGDWVELTVVDTTTIPHGSVYLGED
jgi:hypothetical protein